VLNQVRFVSDSSLIVRLLGAPSTLTSQAVLRLFSVLKNSTEQWPIQNFHPAYCSLLIDFDPTRCDPKDLLAYVAALVANQEDSALMESELVTIPVKYGGEEGPDLAEVTQGLGLDADEFIKLHSQNEYQVAFLGFSPGFPYLLGLPERLHSARKQVPRIRVPQGSVAIAGSQTGIYPRESPGGWQLIGRTGVRLFDPEHEPPTLLKPGDRVQFVPTQEEVAATVQPKIASVTLECAREPLLEVVSGGFFSSIQDLGREGYAHLGISQGGAADPVALRLGNRLVGNSDRAAGIEITATGGTIRFLQDTWIAVTGAECSPRIAQQPLAMWTSFPVKRGQALVVGTMEKRLRSYLCIHGGIEMSPFTDRVCQSGLVGTKANLVMGTPNYRRGSIAIRALYDEPIQRLRVTRGPQWEWFSSESHVEFFLQDYLIGHDVNRMGLRLQGRGLEYSSKFQGQELVSEGVANGAIQVPGGGQPLILYCDQRTTGGYPKIANVVRADWWRLGQLKPGDRIHFEEVTLEDAWRLNQEFESSLESAVHTI
jgi:antagonist of KipI